MADKIRGITIELGGDASGLSKALKGVNSEIKDTQSQLKDVERLLKLDPGNIKLLEQKQRLLNESTEEYRTKLENLKKAQENFNKETLNTKEGQAAWDALNREIISTEDYLAKAEKAASNFNVRLERVGVVANKVADATRGISTAAGAGLAGLGGLAINAVKSADDLNTLAKQTGFSTDELQKFKFAADLVDVPMETIAGAAGKLTKQLGSSEEKFTALGVATRDASGELLPVNEIFYSTLEALGNISNETERDVAAMDIFGKSAAELSGIVDDGGAALKEYGEQAEGMGLILSGDTLNALNETNDKIDTLKATATASMAEVGAQAATALLPLIEDIIAGASSLLEKIGSLDAGQIKLIATILAVVAAISPLASAIANVSKATSVVSGTVLPGLGKAINWLLSNPMALLIVGIVALAALIATKGDEIQERLQALDDWLQNIFTRDWTEVFGPVLGNILNGFMATVKNVWDGIKQIFDGVIDFIRGIFTGDWSRAWNGVKEIFSGIFGALTGIAYGPINAVIGIVNGAIDSVNWLINKINNIPFVNIPNIGRMNFFAKGGSLTDGGTAIVGEAGPELLTVQGGRAIVTPLGGNMGGTTTNSSTTTNMGGINITVNGAPGQDVRELADLIMDEMQAAVNRKGAVFA